MEYVFLDLLNSDWHDWKGSGKSEDRLNRNDWIDGFLSKWNLQIPLNEYAELQSALKDLRILIKSIISGTLHGGALSSINIGRFNTIFANTLYYHKVTVLNQQKNAEADSEEPSASHRISLELEPEKKDINWVLAKIAESLVKVLVNHDPKRLKICANPDCGWFFFDESRGLSRNWCDSKICGNLMKVRRFRERHKQNYDS